MENKVTNEDILKSLNEARKIIDESKREKLELKSVLEEIEKGTYPVTNEFFYGALKQHNENFQDMQKIMHENNKILVERIDDLTRKIEPILEVYTSTKGGVNMIKYVTIAVISFGAFIGALKVIFGIHIKL